MEPTTRHTTDAQALKAWLVWAAERMAGIPDPSVVDGIEAEAEANFIKRLPSLLAEALNPVAMKIGTPLPVFTKPDEIATALVVYIREKEARNG